MARIRTVKPSFFRHPDLQDLEKANPGHHVMLVFAGLWTQCDKAGHFEWQPRMLKLDILPFLDFDMGKTLEILESAGFITRYTVGSAEYGAVPTFAEHQRVSGKEASDPAKHPGPPREAKGAKRGSTREAPKKQPVALGTGTDNRNGVQEQERVVAPPAPAADAAPESDDDVLPVAMDRRPEGEAVRAWNEAAERLGLPTVQRLTKAREAALRQRLHEVGGLEGWAAALAKVEASAFLNGTAPRGRGHENWRCTFDFVVKAENFTKLMEGNFDDGNPQDPTNGFAALAAQIERGSGADDGGPVEPELHARH